MTSNKTQSIFGGNFLIATTSAHTRPAVISDETWKNVFKQVMRDPQRLGWKLKEFSWPKIARLRVASHADVLRGSSRVPSGTGTRDEPPETVWVGG